MVVTLRTGPGGEGAASSEAGRAAVCSARKDFDQDHAETYAKIAKNPPSDVRIE